MRKISLIVITLIGIIFLLGIDRWQVNSWREEMTNELAVTAKFYKNRLEHSIIPRLNAVETIVALFAMYPDTKFKEFAEFSNHIINTNRTIRTLQFADSKTLITYTFPVKGNKTIINKPLNLIEDPKRGPFVKKAIAQKYASVQGPFALREGGSGIVVRSPIFIQSKFIGLAIGVYDVSTLIEEAFSEIELHRFSFRLTDSKEWVFYGQDNEFDALQEKKIQVGDTHWTMAIGRVKGSTSPPISNRVLIWGCGLGFLLLILTLIQKSVTQKTHLEQKVEERTKNLAKSNKSLLSEISQRKSIELVLKDSEKRFRKMIEKSPLPMVITDINQDISFFNDKFTELFGYTSKDVSTAEKWWEMAYPDKTYRDRVQQSWANAIEYAEKNNTDIAMQIWDLTIKDRTRRTCEFYMVPLGDVGLIVMNDITEKKKNEINLKRQALAMDNSSDTIVITDTTGIINYVNPAFQKITGYENAEVLGKDLRVLKSGAHNTQFYEELWNTISGGNIWSGQLINKKKDGSEYTEEVTISPVFSKEGEIINYVAVKRDISDRLKLESKLRQSQKMESIGTLAGGIAHDFNNIMAIILGNTELALDDVPKWNSAHASLEEIKIASFRAKNIVKQLLSFSRKTDQKLQPIQIASVIKDALKFLRSTIPTTINIHRDIIATEEMILADPTQINQIIMNLCINASHAMEQTGGDLNVTVEKVVLDYNSARDYPGLKSGNHIKIMISDTGPGIDTEIINQIFDPYFTTKEVGKGSGMGLAVVHGIVKSHRGAIAVDSSQGKGTKFSILFPLATEKPMVEAQTTQDIPRGSETILFVDDEISITKMVQRMFERLGYKIETATTPQDALERFSLNPDHFDLVITDMTMPQMTGVKLSEKLMDIRKDIPIIVCTGHSNLVDEEKAKELGLAAYVMKPIDMQETAQTIRKVLDKK